MKDSVGRFKALLIDWDGTLIESLPIKISNAATLFSKRFKTDPDEVTASYLRHSGVPRRLLFDRISVDCQGRALAEGEYESLSEAFTETNRRRIAESASLRSGIVSTLSQLNEKGVLLFISTSAAQDEIDFLAIHFGLDRICTNIFGSRPTFSKGREHAEKVMKDFALVEADIAGIGDDTADMELLGAAGVFAIGITGTRSRQELSEAGASIVIDDFEEIIDHVG